MLPSISSGHFGIASKSVYGPDSVQGFGISIVNKPSQGEEDRLVTCPSLPLISEGSFTSLVSKKSGKASEKNNERGNKDDEVTSSRADSDMQSSSLKMTQLQLNCELKNGDRGWCPQGFNPRLANSSRPSHLPVKGLHMMSTSDRLLLQQSLGQPMQSLQRRKDKTTVDRKGYLMTLGGQTNLNSRYRIPAINSPSKEVQSVPSRAPESTSVNLYRRGATCNKPAGVVIHSKCCCRHQKQDGEQRAALKSRSFGSLRSKEGIYKGKEEGSVINQNNHGNTFSIEKRVKPTDRPPPKTLPKTNGISVAQSKKKSKRIINLLASDSGSSLEEERKRVKRALPKQTRQKCPKSPEQKTAPLQNCKSTVTTAVASDPTVESQEKVMIYVETVRESPPTDFDLVKEVIELMDLEHNDEEKEFDGREQPDNLDIISMRSSTVCEQQRSATPRLLKVTSKVPADAAFAQVFRKLDADCDGHISFTELKKSLPQHLTRQQINYLKKIYDMACESTYFGLEEFTAAHQMCDLLAQSSPLVSNALSNMDSSAMDSWLSAFMELFGKADKNQSGIIDMQSFETLLATVINVQPNSFIIQNILGSLGKSNDDTISGVELLAYIPYFVAFARRDA